MFEPLERRSRQFVRTFRRSLPPQWYNFWLPTVSDKDLTDVRMCEVAALCELAGGCGAWSLRLECRPKRLQWGIRFVVVSLWTSCSIPNHFLLTNTFFILQRSTTTPCNWGGPLDKLRNLPFSRQLGQQSLLFVWFWPCIVVNMWK